MARKGKSSKAAQSPMGVPSGTKGHLDIGIEPTENGYVVRICKDDGGKGPSSYSSKRYIASTQGEAMRLAGMGLLGGKASGGKKKGRKAKAYTSKKA